MINILSSQTSKVLKMTTIKIGNYFDVKVQTNPAIKLKLFDCFIILKYKTIKQFFHAWDIIY